MHIPVPLFVFYPQQPFFPDSKWLFPGVGAAHLLAIDRWSIGAGRMKLGQAPELLDRWGWTQELYLYIADMVPSISRIWLIYDR